MVGRKSSLASLLRRLKVSVSRRLGHLKTFQQKKASTKEAVRPSGVGNTFSVLPTELLLDIARYLGRRDLSTLARTERALYLPCLSTLYADVRFVDTSQWKAFCLCLKTFPRYRPAVRRITLECPLSNALAFAKFKLRRCQRISIRFYHYCSWQRLMRQVYIRFPALEALICYNACFDRCSRKSLPYFWVPRIELRYEWREETWTPDKTWERLCAHLARNAVEAEVWLRNKPLPPADATPAALPSNVGKVRLNEPTVDWRRHAPCFASVQTFIIRVKSDEDTLSRWGFFEATFPKLTHLIVEYELSYRCDQRTQDPKWRLESMDAPQAFIHAAKSGQCPSLKRLGFQWLRDARRVTFGADAWAEEQRALSRDCAGDLPIEITHRLVYPV